MSETPHKVKILTAKAVQAKLRRMAYEIYERNYECDRLVIIGIGNRGGYLATRLAEVLREISPLKVELFSAAKQLDDGLALDPGARSIIPGQSVLIVDDVLYSGFTLFEALGIVMSHKPQSVQAAVLIDRGHRNVPVAHDFVGIELATSLQQYVSVEISEAEDKAVAYLF